MRFAGQITGVEGYVESAAMGLMAGRMAAAERRGEGFALPPATTAHGALINHITGGHIETTDKGTGSFQPMNVNFGLFPPVDTPKRVEGKRLDHRKRRPPASGPIRRAPKRTLRPGSGALWLLLQNKPEAGEPRLPRVP